jgi:hypothetical protein
MLKFGLAISLVAVIVISAVFAFPLLSPEPWKHEFDRDEMTDQERHGLNVHGVTKQGREFYFSFVCLGPKTMSIVYNSGYFRPSYKGYKSEVAFRVGRGAAVDSVWYDARMYGFEGSEQERLRELGRRALNDPDWENVEFAFGNLAGQMPETLSLCEDCYESIRYGHGTIETQDIDHILAMMSGLESGQELNIQYGGDISTIAPNEFFSRTYPLVKTGCGY